jgi:hypothetical protein
MTFTAKSMSEMHDVLKRSQQKAEEMMNEQQRPKPDHPYDTERKQGEQEQPKRQQPGQPPANKPEDQEQSPKQQQR